MKIALKGSPTLVLFEYRDKKNEMEPRLSFFVKKFVSGTATLVVCKKICNGHREDSFS